MNSRHALASGIGIDSGNNTSRRDLIRGNISIGSRTAVACFLASMVLDRSGLLLGTAIQIGQSIVSA
eukprot:scaffold5259_cov58-Attheya_sp.AAC.10